MEGNCKLRHFPEREGHQLVLLALREFQWISWKVFVSAMARCTEPSDAVIASLDFQLSSWTHRVLVKLSDAQRFLRSATKVCV